ncbi:MAG: dihydrodipicolinate synthase family protein [Candidatus Solibacter usitatus]|nr:dihydrodipicolinate synthase family protein [Candidatus Solibacter usitatus]
MKLQGIFADLTTPFDHTGALYRTKIQHNLAKWNLTMLAGYVVCGFSGEGALLSADERVEMWAQTAARAGKDRLLIGGLDSPGVHESVALAGRAAELGYAAVLAETPHYDAAAPPGLPLLYYRALADRSPVPVLVANRPRVTGIDLGAEQLVELSQHPNIAGVADFSGDVEKVQRVSRQTSLLAGCEQTLWRSLRAGASGAVLAMAAAAPYATIALWEAFRTREEEAGLDWQARIANPAALITTSHGVPGLKCALDTNGYYGGPPRLPSSVPSPAVRTEIAEAFRDLKG